MNTKPVTVRIKSSDVTLLSPDTEVRIEGHAIERCTALRIESKAGEETKVTIEAFAYDGLDIELPAAVSLTIITLDDFSLEETALPNGGRRLRAVPALEP